MIWLGGSGRAEYMKRLDYEDQVQLVWLRENEGESHSGTGNRLERH